MKSIQLFIQAATYPSNHPSIHPSIHHPSIHSSIHQAMNQESYENWIVGFLIIWCSKVPKLAALFFLAILSCYYGYTNYFKMLNFPFSNIPRGFPTFEVLSPTINNSRNIKLQISYIFNSIAKFGTFSVTLLTLKSHFSLCMQNIKLKFSRFCNVKYCKNLEKFVIKFRDGSCRTFKTFAPFGVEWPHKNLQNNHFW